MLNVLNRNHQKKIEGYVNLPKPKSVRAIFCYTKCNLNFILMTPHSKTKGKLNRLSDFLYINEHTFEICVIKTYQSKLLKKINVFYVI